MPVEQNPDAYARGETQSWAWPVYAFVAWLATLLDYITRFKRIRHTHRFKSNWRDNWDGLRESEWHLDQLIAQGVAQILAGEPLQLDDTKIQLTPPASYGGPCPRSPFDMNRRFIALARWAVDPEAIIRARFKRLARSLLAAHRSTDTRSAATHDAVGVASASSQNSLVALMVSSDRRERPSNHEGGLTSARGPPQFYALLATRSSPRKRKLPGSPPLARHPQPAYPPSHVHARRHPSTSSQGHSTPCAGASLTMTGRRRKRRRPSSRPTLR